MRAIDKALSTRPDTRPGAIIRYGCPDRYGIGVKPDWCPYREEYLENEPASEIEQYTGHWPDICGRCWCQEVLEKGEIA